MSFAGRTEALGEDGARAAGGGTHEATYTEAEGDRTSGAGTVGDAAPVAAMDSGRAPAAQRAGGSAPGGADGEEDGLLVDGDIVDGQAGEVGEQPLETHRRPLGGEARHDGARLPMFYGIAADPQPPEARQSRFSPEAT